MANIEDLGNKSISEMDNDEAIEYMRELRLKRRTPTTRTVTRAKRNAKTAKKSVDPSPSQARELLKLLGHDA